MASLRSMILDGRVCGCAHLKPAYAELEQRLFHRLQEMFRQNRNRYTLIDATTVLNDLVERDYHGENIQLGKVPLPKPPLHHIWMEGSWQRHHAVLLDRYDTPTPAALERALHRISSSSQDEQKIFNVIRTTAPASLIEGLLFEEWKDGAAFVGEILYWLDNDGGYLDNSGFSYPAPATEEEKYEALTRLFSFMAWTFHTMARLNCSNVELKPIPGQGKKIKGSWKPVPPSSVWHEIVVKPSPLVKRARAEDPTDAEKHAVRLHKVRGHYADYRAGAGLFGKYKVLIWVDEHESGDADLGTVVASYRVE